MLPVEILPVQETIVLRARGSELLILPHHVKELKGMTKPKDFSEYFRAEALVNRPARKLFEAWLRKDGTLWPRLYQTIHKEMDLSGSAGESPAEKPAKKAAKDGEPAKADKVKAKEKEAPKPAKAEKAAAPAKKEKTEAKPVKAAKDEKPAKAKAAAPAKEAKDDKPAAKAKAEKPAAKAKAEPKTKEKAKPAAKKKG